MRSQALYIGGNARNEATAADRDEYHVDLARRLAQDLHGDGALPCDDIGIVIRMDEHEPALASEAGGVRIGVIVGVTVKHDFGAARSYGGHLDLRCRHGHDDRRGAIEFLGGERYPLRMIACRSCDDATP